MYACVNWADYLRLCLPCCLRWKTQACLCSQHFDGYQRRTQQWKYQSCSIACPLTIRCWYEWSDEKPLFRSYHSYCLHENAQCQQWS